MAAWSSGPATTTGRMLARTRSIGVDAAAMPMLGYAQQMQGAGINYTAARPGRLILDLAIRSNETKREESGRRGGGARLWG